MSAYPYYPELAEPSLMELAGDPNDCPHCPTPEGRFCERHAEAMADDFRAARRTLLATERWRLAQLAEEVPA